MRRLLPAALVAVFLLALPAAAVSSTWPNPKNIHLTALAHPAVAAWNSPCGKKGQGHTIAVRTLGSSFGAVHYLSKCGDYLQSQPALAYTAYRNRLYTVWSESPVLSTRSTRHRGVYYSYSTNGGRTWSKQILAFSTNQFIPPPVQAAAYVQKLWIMWAELGRNTAANVPFHIEQINGFTHKRGKPIGGLSSYRVFPDSDAMRLFANKDGIIGFWRSGCLTCDGVWYYADTQRVDPYDVSKHVIFLKRGSYQEQAKLKQIHFFNGLDSHTYTLIEGIVHTADGHSIVSYHLYRYAFLQHQFVPAFSNTPANDPGLILSTVGPIILSPPEVAAQVDVRRNFYLVYGDLGADSENGAYCLVPTSLNCVSAAPGQAFSQGLSKVAKFPYQSGQMGSIVQLAPLRLPVTTAPAAANGGVYVEGFLSYNTTRANTIVQTGDGFHVFSGFLQAQVPSGHAGETTYITDPLSSKPSRSFYFGPAFH